MRVQFPRAIRPLFVELHLESSFIADVQAATLCTTAESCGGINNSQKTNCSLSLLNSEGLLK